MYNNTISYLKITTLEFKLLIYNVNINNKIEGVDWCDNRGILTYF